jgi:CHAT domain-containing protein
MVSPKLSPQTPQIPDQPQNNRLPQPQKRSWFGLKQIASGAIACLATTLSLANMSPAIAQTVIPDMTPEMLTEAIMGMERRLEGEFEDYFGRDLAEVTQTNHDIANTLNQIAEETGSRAAVMWVIPREDHLHLVLVTPEGDSVVRDLYDVPYSLLRQTMQEFQQDITNPVFRNPRQPSQQLYDWIIGTFEADFLEPQDIDMLLFCLGDGIRGLSLAALHDGEQYLIEKYALTRIPAFNLIRTDYVNIQQSDVLAMGASEFEELPALPAVPVELTTILQELQTNPQPNAPWGGRPLLNQDFTLDNFQTILAEQPFEIVHLATHAEFKSGAPNNSYIQFWDTQLNLADMGQVDWNSEELELLVLSACRTAIGDSEAELGFAGLALQAGVPSALASLWYVSDSGTLALMSEFYRQLTTAPTRAEALRQAQIRMLRGEVRFEEGNLLLSRGPVPLPDTLAVSVTGELSHPLYWAGFTLISSPW